MYWTSGTSSLCFLNHKHLSSHHHRHDWVHAKRKADLSVLGDRILVEINVECWRRIAGILLSQNRMKPKDDAEPQAVATTTKSVPWRRRSLRGKQCRTELAQGSQGQPMQAGSSSTATPVVTKPGPGTHDAVATGRDHHGTGNLRAGTDVSDPLPSELREQDPSIKQSQQTHSPSTCSVSPILVMEDVSVCRSCDLLEHFHHLSVIDILDFLGMIVKSSVLKLFF